MTSPAPEAALHEIRTEWRAGRSLGRVYVTPNGTLEARLDPVGARLHRRTGPHTPDATLRWDDLATLARAFARWREVRDDWAAYYEKHVVASSVLAQVYWPPGAASERRTIGFAGPVAPERAGIRLVGRDELRAIPTPRPVAPGIDAIAEFWRVEPRVGPRDGERIGERWVADGRAVIDLRRIDARSIHGESRFTWLAYEADVPAELLALREASEGGADG